MDTIDLLMLEIEEKMEEAVQQTDAEFQTIRTGRANPALLDAITVEYYGVDTPLKQISAITIPEGNQLYIKPFDKSALKQIEYAIGASSLGLTPQNDGTGIRLILPQLTGERRKELSRDVDRMAESGKVIIRNIRRDANNDIKKLELAEDTEFAYLEDVQKLTDKYVEKMDEIAKIKVDEIMAI